MRSAFIIYLFEFEIEMVHVVLCTLMYTGTSCV